MRRIYKQRIINLLGNSWQSAINYENICSLAYFIKRMIAGHFVIISTADSELMESISDGIMNKFVREDETILFTISELLAARALNLVASKNRKLNTAWVHS